MSSSRSKNSDPLSHSHRTSSLSINDTGFGSSTMSVDGLLRDINSSSESTLLDAQINVVDVPPSSTPKSADQVWREIISGDNRRLPKQPKEEIPDEMMTLEEFLAQAGATPKEEDEEEEEEEEEAVVEDEDVKAPLPLATQPLSSGGGVFSFDKMEFGGIGKRGSGVLEPLDKAAAQRQRRMIKNRESAARSRERKQAYQVELEALAVKLEEENDSLMKEKEERTRARHKQLMEKLVPIVDKPKTVRVFRRVRSFQW